MTERLLTADQHFGHANVIKYENRPFSSVEEMDEFMIAKWNARVKKKSMVFHLGDFSFYPKDKTAEILSRLHGDKIIVLGNHDDRSTQWYYDVGFYHVSRWPIIIDEFFILSHAPVYMNEAMPYMNIHGHLHSKWMEGANFYNVGVECNNYTPLSIDEIKKRFALLKSKEVSK